MEAKKEILKFRALYSYEYMDALLKQLSNTFCDNQYCETDNHSDKKPASEMCELTAINNESEVAFIINKTCCSRFGTQIKYKKEEVLKDWSQFLIS